MLNVVLVDEQDREIGVDEKLKVHQEGRLHRAFSVFIFRKNKKNNNIELLLQQREKNKYHCGGLWTNTCCSHPMPGEDIVLAGERRLQEEMLFSVKLYKVASFCYKAKFDNGLTEHEFDHVLVGSMTDEINEITKVNNQEVQDYRWLDFKSIELELANYPDNFTPWFSMALELVKSHWQTIEDLLPCLKL